MDERAAGGFAKASAPVAVARPATDALVDAERTHILRVLESCYWTIEGPGETVERLSLVPSTRRKRMKRFGIRRRARQS